MVYTRSLLLGALAGLSAVNAIPTIEVKGSKFFTSDGDQFYVKGKHLPCSTPSTTLVFYYLPQHEESQLDSTNLTYTTGIAYQLVPDDPLIDATQCGLDASLMKTLGTNSIRVYHVDPEGDHKDCMKAFADAGSTYTSLR